MLSNHIGRIAARFCTGKPNFTLMPRSEKEAYLQKLEQKVKLTYKQYPQLPHQDPKSPEYIYSELDEYREKTEVNAYNTLIDNFKYDLKLQREVWNAINNLDRPYKRGTPGIHTNLDPNGVAKPKLQDLGFPRSDPLNDVEYTFTNEDRFIANTPFISDIEFSNIKQWEQERRNRPVTKNIHSKGYKYDVEVKPEEKFEYTADRLGHPEFVGTPFEVLFRLESDMYHPTYLDQPFVKVPSPKPHASLNFEQGEVLYENTRVLEWIKFYQTFITSAIVFVGLFVPYNMVFKTNLVTDAATEFNFDAYHLVTPANMDIARLSIPIAAGVAYYTTFLVMNFTNAIVKDYVIKMTYSKDKELLFVKRADVHGAITEQVYEVAHLEIVPPSVRSGVGHLSSQDEDGLWRITCMNTHDEMLAYNNNNNWNRDLKDAFLKGRLNMWDKSYYGYNRDEKAENERKWREEVFATFDQQALPKA